MKNEIIEKNLAEVVYYPSSELEEIDMELAKAQKFPIEQATTLGVAFKPLMQLISLAQGNTGKSGLYFVNTYGKKMFKSDGQFIGNLQMSDGRVGGGIARMTQVSVDPTMLCMAVALMSIERKLDAIQEAQKDILAFLELKEEAKLKGNIKALEDILNNYKYNWNNEKYKNNKHILVQEIKRDAEQSIIFYRDRLKKQLKQNSLLHRDKKVDNLLDEIVARLNDYQLALYMFAFSSFMEVMLLENFDSDYLNGVTEIISEYLQSYNEFYQLCEEKIQKASNSSIESVALRGLSTVSSGAGKLARKIPGINKSKLEANLIEASGKLMDAQTNKMKNLTEVLSDSQKDCVSVFIHNIQIIDRLFNYPLQIMFDEENIYLTEN